MMTATKRLMIYRKRTRRDGVGALRDCLGPRLLQCLGNAGPVFHWQAGLCPWGSHTGRILCLGTGAQLSTSLEVTPASASCPTAERGSPLLCALFLLLSFPQYEGSPLDCPCKCSPCSPFSPQVPTGPGLRCIPSLPSVSISDLGTPRSRIFRKYQNLKE